MVGTIMKKELIKTRFSKSLNSYQKNAVVQKKMAEVLVSKIQKKRFENVLEIGCGTGFLTKLLTEKINYKSYVATDIVEECKLFISKIDKNIEFTPCDIEKFKPDRKFDLIVSNAVFQWVTDLSFLIKNLKSYLSQDGIIVFSTFGDKNFQELNNISNLSLNYLSLEELRKIFSDYEIDCLEESEAMLEFPSIREMFEHMKKTGVNSLSEKTWTIKDFKRFEESYNATYTSVHLTYNPVYVVIR
jgi:malonyl-CoA O-methyltransferase